MLNTRMKEKQFCRCCLSEDCCKNISDEYIIGDRKEIYAEMLLNTFNINIILPQNSPCFICDSCVTILREATEFKKKVISSQETIMKEFHWSNNGKYMEIYVEDIDDELEDTLSDTFSDSHFMGWADHQSTKGETLVLTPGAKIVKNKILEKSKLDKEVPNATHTQRVSDKKSINKIYTLKRKINEMSRSSIPKTKTAKNSTKVKVKPKKSSSKCAEITQTEIDVRQNTLKLIQNSNLCLFRSFKTRFGCFMCDMTFVEAPSLREHSLTHDNTSFLADRVNKWRGLSYKNADISELQCKQCNENVKDLTELANHLTIKHEITFCSTDTYLIPYKLLNSQCVLCESKFNTFLRLSMHMNSHYPNNVCEICGLPFINRMSLRMHVQAMHKEKKCPRCPAKFLTDTSKVAHLRKIHNVHNNKRYCNMCDKTFSYTYLLVQHKVEVHGAKQLIVKCDVCGKQFFSNSNLQIHIRCVHIKERNYPCDICGRSFFTKTDRKRHGKTHNDVRSFTCTHCDSKFKSKDSTRRHMKHQHGHMYL